MRCALKLSIIIVSYNVRQFLEQALISIKKALRTIQHEIVVVDNSSADGTASMIGEQFPEVKLLANSMNRGFARANNQALAICRGEILCLINPDTLVQENTFEVLVRFFDHHPRAGAVGCKILNPDGSLQLACRRSIPTPWVAFTKISGLARLFPNSRTFGRYNLTFLDPDQTTEVEAISGSFMMVRRSAIDQVGLLDPDFFMYGEDLDWCFRIRKAGWKIYYVPETQIIHFKGESSKKSPFEQRRMFYEAMHRYVKKHFSRGEALVPSWLLIMAIWMRSLLSFISALLRAMAWPLLDFIVLSASFAVAIWVRFQPEFPWSPFLVVHLTYSLVWLASLAGQGCYHTGRFSAAKAVYAVLLGWVVNSALTFFFNQYGFSRLVVLVAGACNLFALPGWRIGLRILARFGFPLLRGRWPYRRRSLIVGDSESAEKIIHRMRARPQMPYQIEGVLLVDGAPEGDQLAGVPVYGPLSVLNEVVRSAKIQEVIFSTDQIEYDRLLSIVAQARRIPLSFKLVPSDLDVIIGKASIDVLHDLPLVDLDYELHHPLPRRMKRMFDLLLSGLLIAPAGLGILWFKWIRRVPMRSLRWQGENGTPIALSEFETRRWRRLPWLFAVVRGDLSFVGRELRSKTDYPDNEISLSIKPGLTGLEQVNDRFGLNAEDRVKYHLYYLKNYSLFLDMGIVLKTVFRR